MAKEDKQAAPTSVRVTATCMRLWNELARRQGLTRTGYLETTMRRLATEAGIEWDDTIETAQKG